MLVLPPFQNSFFLRNEVDKNAANEGAFKNGLRDLEGGKVVKACYKKMYLSLCQTGNQVHLEST